MYIERFQAANGGGGGRLVIFYTIFARKKFANTPTNKTVLDIMLGSPCPVNNARARCLQSLCWACSENHLL